MLHVVIVILLNLIILINCNNIPNSNVPMTFDDIKFKIDALPASENPFHIAIPVHSIKEAREFYGNVLGFKEGRRCDDKWQDYSFYGHQLVCHYVGEDYKCHDYYNPVDGDEVPVPHYGICLKEEEFHQLADRLKESGVKFIIEPHKRFAGQPGEQYTMFFKDPSNNNLEIKALTNPKYLFAQYNVKN